MINIWKNITSARGGDVTFFAYFINNLCDPIQQDYSQLTHTMSRVIPTQWFLIITCNISSMEHYPIFPWLPKEVHIRALGGKAFVKPRNVCLDWLKYSHMDEFTKWMIRMFIYKKLHAHMSEIAVIHEKKNLHAILFPSLCEMMKSSPIVLVPQYFLGTLLP